MNCKCGVPAFFYTTIDQDRFKCQIFKCGSVVSELKSKVKCDFKIEKKLNLVIEEKIVSKTIDEIKEESFDFESSMKKEIERYIYLYEISKNNFGLCRNNYLSNINYYLRKLNFPLFFIEKESLESLKVRITNNYVKKNKRKNDCPLKLLEIPDNLMYTPIKKSRLIHKTKSTPKSIEIFTCYSEENIIKKFDNLEILSDVEESDTKSDIDNTFDIDDYESDLEDDSKNIYWGEDD
jgi:hypothetical protein